MSFLEFCRSNENRLIKIALLICRQSNAFHSIQKPSNSTFVTQYQNDKQQQLNFLVYISLSRKVCVFFFQIVVDDSGRVEGVRLEGNDRVLRSPLVLSNATPKITFLDLLPEGAAAARGNKTLPSDYMTSVQNIDYTSPVTKINVALNKLPNFLADPNETDNQVEKITFPFPAITNCFGIFFV